MGIFGDLVQGALGGFPTIPHTPAPAYVNPQQAQTDSIAGNQAALPSLEHLGSDINAYNLSERSKALNVGIRGWSDITETGSNLLQSQLRGELPTDVADQVERGANAHAFAGGYGGGNGGYGTMKGNLSLRDFGLNSLQQQARGQSNAPPWLSMMNSLAVPPQYNINGDLISPTQQIQSQQWNENNRYAQQWQQNVLDSIPDPETAAIAKDVGQITDLVATAALAWAGGVGGLAVGGASGAAIGGQLGGGIGGGGGLGGAGGSFGSMLGGLMGGGGGGGGGSPTGDFSAALYQPQVNQTVSPFGNSLGASTYDPGLIGGYSTYPANGYGYGAYGNVY